MAKGGQMGGGFSNLRDMFDGGGMGRAGQRFEGGPLSGMLNDMGVRPMGYADRMAEQRPQMRPMQPAMMTSRSGPGPMQGPGMPQMQGPGYEPMQGPMQSLNQPGNEVDPEYITRLMEAAQRGDPNAIQMLQRMASGML